MSAGVAAGGLFQLAPEFGELTSATSEQGACRAVGGIVMVDERDKFRELIVKAITVGCHPPRPGGGVESHPRAPLPERARGAAMRRSPGRARHLRGRAVLSRAGYRPRKSVQSSGAQHRTRIAHSRRYEDRTLHHRQSI